MPIVSARATCDVPHAWDPKVLSAVLYDTLEVDGGYTRPAPAAPLNDPLTPAIDVRQWPYLTLYVWVRTAGGADKLTVVEGGVLPPVSPLPARAVLVFSETLAVPVGTVAGEWWIGHYLVAWPSRWNDQYVQFYGASTTGTDIEVRTIVTGKKESIG